MKFNQTYAQQINLIDSIKESNKFVDTLQTFFKKKYSLLEVSSPIITEENNPSLIDLSHITRKVSFDKGDGKIVAYNISNSNWGRSFILRNNFKTNHGIFFRNKTIWRDLKESPVSSIIKDEITFMMRINPSEVNKELSKITDQLYFIFYEMAERIQKKYKIKNIFPVDPWFTTAQQLENEFPGLNFSQRENEIINERTSIVLKNPAAILFSGKTHSEVPIPLYDVTKYNQLLLSDRVNSFAIKAASVAIMLSGEEMEKQFSLYEKNIYASNPYYQNLITEKRKVIEVKVNIPRLCMALLGKAHLSEVQADVISDEKEMIDEKFDIETY